MAFPHFHMKLDSPLISDDINKTTGTVLVLVEPLLKQGFTVCMDNFYNLPLQKHCMFLKKRDCAGTLKVKRKNPEAVKDQELK
jgi:hypothetical protein